MARPTEATVGLLTAWWRTGWLANKHVDRITDYWKVGMVELVNWLLCVLYRLRRWPSARPGEWNRHLTHVMISVCHVTTQLITCNLHRRSQPFWHNTGVWQTNMNLRRVWIDWFDHLCRAYKTTRHCDNRAETILAVLTWLF